MAGDEDIKRGYKCIIQSKCMTQTSENDPGLRFNLICLQTLIIITHSGQLAAQALSEIVKSVYTTNTTRRAMSQRKVFASETF